MVTLLLVLPNIPNTKTLLICGHFSYPLSLFFGLCALVGIVSFLVRVTTSTYLFYNIFIKAVIGIIIIIYSLIPVPSSDNWFMGISRDE